MGGTGRRPACTRCRIRSVTNSTGRKGIRLAGRMRCRAPCRHAMVDGTGAHRTKRIGDRPRWVAPRPPGCQRADRHHTNRRRHKPALSRAEGTNRRSDGQASRLHLVSASFTDEADGQERHSARWPNAVDGTTASARQAGPTKRIGNRVVNEPRGITPIAEGTNRRSGGQASRLHLVSASFADEADGQERHTARWPNAVDGTTPTGMPTSRPASHQSPKAQAADPAGGRAGTASGY